MPQNTEIEMGSRDWYKKLNKQLLDEINNVRDKKTIIVITGEKGQGMSYFSYRIGKLRKDEK